MHCDKLLTVFWSQHFVKLQVTATPRHDVEDYALSRAAAGA